MRSPMWRNLSIRYIDSLPWTSDLGSYPCLYMPTRHLRRDPSSILHSSTSYLVGLLLLATHLGMHVPYRNHKLATCLVAGSVFLQVPKRQISYLQQRRSGYSYQTSRAFGEERWQAGTRCKPNHAWSFESRFEKSWR